MNANLPGVSAVIVSYNTKIDTLRCLASLHDATARPLEIVLVDNDSTDETAAAVRDAYPDVIVIEPHENLGFSRANNLGLRRARHPYALIINSDAEARPGAIDALAQLLDERPRVAIAAPRTFNSDGRLQLSFGPPLTPLRELRRLFQDRALRARQAAARDRLEKMCREERRPAWVSGSCFLARAQVLTAVGLFDEKFFLYEEDVDLCLRVRRAGWTVVFTPTADIVHHEGRSAAHDRRHVKLEYHRSHLRYYRKHNGPLATAALRLWLLGRAGFGWLAALLRRRGRAFERELMRLAWKPDPL
ncbi:MAG: glycosyltransferase family 2 protein [Vicinamibacteria bacterium]|nr:glycosyltransferase family 2 protein [Vicinamibacteria bacterium]